ncbi:MAG: hypothetical protein Q4E38_03055 [Eubacteriales bacterium]|nr:hypothetical protein [Eubacteriales bacterium]
MKRFISYLLTAVMLVSVLACGFGTAAADEATVTIEASDVDLQLSLIATQLSKLKQEDGANTWYYSVTDLNHNGNLEFIAATLHPQDRSTNLKVWEISDDRSSLTECKLAKDEDESFPDIMTDVADTYHDVETDTWSYMFYDNLVISADDVYTVKTAVSLKESVLDYEAFAVQHTQADKYGRGVSYTDANGISISPDQYNAAGSNAFAGAERSSTNFSWLTGKDVDSLSRLIDSYAVFSGAKEPTEVFPVPRPALLQDGSPAVTPAPSATPVPVQEVKYLGITKNPTNENRKEKDTALFVACANAYESLNWTFVAPNGGEYSVQNFRNVFPRASVTGEYSTTLAVGNVEADMNGWGAYCTFYYRGQTARTTTAYIYVKNEPVPESGSLDGYVTELVRNSVTIEVPGVDFFTLDLSKCTVVGELYVGAPATIYYSGRHARGVDVTSATIRGGTAPDSGVYNGTVTDWGYSTVTVNLDGTTSVALDWSICSLSGEIYVGAPATAYWNGTTAKGLNFTYCVIEGHQPDPDPVYGSMSGIAHEGGGGFAIDLQNGTEVYVDGWKCSVSGEFYDGASCIVYYTEPLNVDSIYQVDIYGSAPAAPEDVVPETVYSSISGTAFLDSPGTAVLFLDNGGTYYVDVGICNQIGELVMAGGGNSCVAYYYNDLGTDTIYNVDVYPAEDSGL